MMTVFGRNWEFHRPTADHAALDASRTLAFQIADDLLGGFNCFRCHRQPFLREGLRVLSPLPDNSGTELLSIAQLFLSPPLVAWRRWHSLPRQSALSVSQPDAWPGQLAVKS
jgi:hypothetical protein